MLTGKDIVGIIRAGNAAKAVRIEIGDLKIVYREAEEAPPAPFVAQETLSTGVSEPKIQSASMDELLLTDPAAFEAQLLMGNSE